MADQAFDPALESDGRGRATRAGAVHGEIEMAVAIALVGNVAAVLGDCGTDSRLDQLLDLLDDVGVSRIFVEIGGDVDAGGAARREQRRMT